MRLSDMIRKRSLIGLTLPLLMARILANDTDDPLASDDFAFNAYLLN